MSNAKNRTTANLYSYPGGRTPTRRKIDQYGSIFTATIRSLSPYFGRVDLPSRLRAMTPVTGLIIVLIVPLLLISDSLGVFALLMSNHAVGLLLGLIKFKLTAN